MRVDFYLFCLYLRGAQRAMAVSVDFLIRGLKLIPIPLDIYAYRFYTRSIFHGWCLGSLFGIGGYDFKYYSCRH